MKILMENPNNNKDLKIKINFHVKLSQKKKNIIAKEINHFHSIIFLSSSLSTLKILKVDEKFPASKLKRSHSTRSVEFSTLFKGGAGFSWLITPLLRLESNFLHSLGKLWAS